MNLYEVEARIVGADWDGIAKENPMVTVHHPCFLIVEIPAQTLAGLDLTRPVTIVQDEKPERGAHGQR